MELLYNDVGMARIKSKMVRKWKGGPVLATTGASWYGLCRSRPRSRPDAHGTSCSRPSACRTVDWALKTKCCGGRHRTIHMWACG